MKYTMKTLVAMVLSISLAPDCDAQKQGQARIDSLIQALPKMKDDSNKVVALKNISFEYSLVNTDLGLEYGQKAWDLADNIGWEKGKAWASNSKGINYLTRAEYAKAEGYYRRSLEINQRIGHKRGVAINYRNLGILNDRKSNYVEALSYARKSLKIYDELHDKEGIAAQYCNIGVVYLNLQEYAKAIDNSEKALEICKELNNQKDIAVNANNIGYAYAAGFQDYEKAINNYAAAVMIYKRLGDKEGLSRTYRNIGLLCNKQRYYSNALEYYNKSLKEAEELKSDAALQIIYANMGRNYLSTVVDSNSTDALVARNRLAKLKDAAVYLDKAILIAESVGAKDELIDYYKNKSDVLYMLGDNIAARQAGQKSAAIKNTIFSDQVLKQIDDLEKMN